MQGRVLVVAGSDSGGGAGIQADIKTVMALGGYATTAITALTAQDTHGVHGVVPVPARFVEQQMVLALSDIGADAVKTGMLGSVDVVGRAAAALAGRDIPLVVDPVMIAKGGHALADDAVMRAMVRLLLPDAAVVTPNVPEAEALLGAAIADMQGMQAAAQALLRLGPAAVLLKGGHMPGSLVTDLLATAGGIEALSAPRIHSRHTHGTGCTLASAVAVGLAQGLALPAAVRRAHAYVQRAIAEAPGLGGGHGPLNHAVTLDPSRLT